MFRHDNGSAYPERAAARDRNCDWSEPPSPLRRLATETPAPLRLRATRSGEPAVEPAPDPDALLQAARACMRRDRVSDAVLLAELACELAPEDVRCRALLAWLRVQRGEAPLTLAGDELLKLLTRAVRQHPDDLELRMYRGRALQRLGRATDALRDFSYVASADPHNVDAAREVRLHEMRARESHAGSGVFSRLLERLSRHPPAPKPSEQAPRYPSRVPVPRRGGGGR